MLLELQRKPINAVNIVDRRWVALLSLNKDVTLTKQWAPLKTGTKHAPCWGAGCTARDIYLPVCVGIIHWQREIRGTILPSPFLGCSSISSRAETVICFFLLPQPPSLFIRHIHTHTHTQSRPAVAAHRAAVMSLRHSQQRLGHIWWGPPDKSWIWLRTKRSPISQAACNKVLGLLPPLAGIWRFATQTSAREEALPLIHHCKSMECGVFFSPSRMNSLLPFMYSLCPEPRFLLRRYHCAFHTDTLSEFLCHLIFIFAEVSWLD